MGRRPEGELRRGWTTGACATAALKAALQALWSGDFPDPVAIRLPGGEEPVFALAHRARGTDGAGLTGFDLVGAGVAGAASPWAEAGITKDAGDDPDVTHGALVVVRARALSETARVRALPDGIVFRAGEGVGTVTMPGLPLPVGEPAINPVPRRMMTEVVEAARKAFGPDLPGVEITVSVPGGRELAARTWNPRLGIVGGLSILGTTGIVRPFSCAAWIASIHRGIDVARAAGLAHVAGCTGAMSEKAVQATFGLPDHAMLDMGDFAGGMLKYLRRHPVARLTIGGGIGKLSKLAQGAMDLHSGRSQVDLGALADWTGDARLREATTALHALQIAGPGLAGIVAARARDVAQATVGPDVAVDVVVVDREGLIVGRA